MKVRTGSKYRFEACGLDIWDRRENTPKDGTIVKVVQPHGCPKNNTMGHCFVSDLEGNFIGLVSTGSLHKI